MEQDFEHILPAIWLVFGGTHLNHCNAPKSEKDHREQVLVDLLHSYLKGELLNPSIKLLRDLDTWTQLTTVYELLKLWSQDLSLIYQIREGPKNDSQVRRLAQRFLQRVKTFENCTIIPNGLITALLTGDKHAENVSLAVLKRQNGRINWIQVDPGSAYHQHCEHVAGEKCNAFLEILEIDPNNITEDWLYLLVGLKTVRPEIEKSSYKDVSLYECLLSHLNGKTVFQTEPDEGFILCSHVSPAHTWQVIEQSFRYLLRHFLGDAYLVVYQRLITNFKLSLIEKTLAAYQDQLKGGKQIEEEQCNFLLQEMCRDVAQQALDQGDANQKTFSFELINAVKKAIEKQKSLQEELICRESQLDRPHVESLKFVAPCLKDHTHPSGAVTSPSLLVDPVFVMPRIQEDIIAYLKHFKRTFINDLVNAKDINGTALLSYGIETFFINYLAQTDILDKSTNSCFSKDDNYLAQTLEELAGIYYGCQSRLVKGFLSNTTYEPQFYAKNVVIQFFVYAAVAALNYRDRKIGPLLVTHNLSIATSGSLVLTSTVPQLVLEDSRWVKVLLATQAFFTPKTSEGTLFSTSQFTFELKNDADQTDTDVKFALQLLQKYPSALRRFTDVYQDLEDEKFCRKWSILTYTTLYLPSLFLILSKLANMAKVSLTGFPLSTNNNRVATAWIIEKKTKRRGARHFRRQIAFQINKSSVSSERCSDLLTSYLIKWNHKSGKDPYQKFITCKEKESKGKASIHLLENEIIANQGEKPETMDSNHYMQLGILQSEPWIKMERLYIALKENQLDFSCKQEAVLIKQTLFEISLLVANGKICSLLEWTVHHTPDLVHRFGLLCIEKARAMQYRLSQHHAIGDILSVSLGLLTFYPPAYKDVFIQGIVDIYRLLKEILTNPSNHLSDNTLLHLNAYLLIALQTKPQLLETDTLAILFALLAIQNYQMKGTKLANCWLLRVRSASFTWSSCFERQLAQDQSILNKVMLTVMPKWNQSHFWHKSNSGLMFTSKDYAIKPLLGCIYFKNQPIQGMPDKITGHILYKEYLGEVTFPVLPGAPQISSGQQVPCYLSVDRTPQLRLTLIGSELVIEEFIETHYQRFIPAKELSGGSNCSRLIYELPNNKAKLRHWLNNDKNILIKDEQRRVIFKWDLRTNFLFSLQHGGYVVPWEQLQESFFKTCLELIESPAWIELIAQPSSHSSDICIESLNFPRLGLRFNYQHGEFFSKQVHGYIIAKEQYLNTLQGFYNYLVLELKEENSVRKQVKVIIPHRKVTLKGPFYVNATTVDRNEIQTPAYFVYDYDLKMGLLKGHHIRAHLYLALLYFRSASLDEDDLSHCNAYHLARENLELCWKDEPYDNIELDIIEQLLNVPAIHQRGPHSNLVALYLKVVSLLSSSLRLSFLFMGEIAQENKRRSDELLERCAYKPSHFLLKFYLQNKSNIFARIRLSPEEEKDAMKHCSRKIEENCVKHSCPEEEEDAMKDCPVAPLPNAKNCYNSHYREFFHKEGLITTAFQRYFHEHISNFSFVYDVQGINFASGINGILISRFRLVHFITLYNLAKKSAVSIEKYCYLLHHLLIRAKINYQSVEAKMVMTLARALLIVAENPSLFPDSPSWFNKSDLSVNLSQRQVIKTEVLRDFPSFNWTYQSHLSNDENEMNKRQARNENLRENEEIWSCFETYDLDRHGIPCCLPGNRYNFTLRYETCINFCDLRKRNIVRERYLQAAYNDAMYQFFACVFRRCDELKHASRMGWTVAPFIHKTIKVTLKAGEEHVSPCSEPVSLEKWTIVQQPLIDLYNFFAVDSLPAENGEFLFESQLGERKNGYQRQFYLELKNSWLVYTNEAKCSYSWLSAQSVNELESVLRTKYYEIHDQAERVWNKVAAQFKQRSNSESNDYFALRWYSGQVRHYHKRDILRLLIEPHKLPNYNPDCLNRGDTIIQELLQYVTHEINSAKIVRVLALIDQYKCAQKEAERFSLLQSLVRSLQENVDPASYRYPHWFLFQFENEIIVRDNQRELIVAMLSQTEKAMYQLNMGEGKSSVILPLLSYNLANGQQLLRINVLSALLNTAKEFLRQRFSGLIQKRVYPLPFSRGTNISSEHLQLIYETLQTCQHSQHILLTTPEHRLCLQLKIRELMLENQQQKRATNIFNWETYRQRAHPKIEVYNDLNANERELLLKDQDHRLRTCLLNERYIDSNNVILKIPARGQENNESARFKKLINDSKFREWSCLKAAYRELLYNSTLAYEDCSEKLALLNKIGAVTAIDLLDESDEILKHGTELNYTVGDKHVFAGGELRWQIPQFFINAIFCDIELRDVITKGKTDGFTTMNPHFSSQGGVPFIQLLNESYYEDQIKPLLINKFFTENISSLRKYHLSADSSLVQGEAASLTSYVAGKLKSNIEKKVMGVLSDKSSLKDKVLIAKGWLSHGILFHVFNAKYRVHYGLNLNSAKQVAVPFFGKDAPSPRSEFSHPDVMLGFTIISYLYQGLNQEQLKETLNKLKDKFSHQVADAQLSAWTQAGRPWIESLTDEFPPLLLTSLQHIDLEEEQCLEKVHQYLSGNYMAISFYLNQFVLLEEAMQYLHKISANAHSLVGYDAALGFSGTDDRKITMPFEIKPLCSKTQEGTNGKLLSVLTQERNSSYHSLQTEDTVDLLTKLSNYVRKWPNCHALIDAGALVTGLTNHAVAEFLLALLPSNFLGILYFSDESNSLTVLTRDKKTSAFQDCYLDKQHLFAYLDDIHTRGTDIQLPLNCHAILTIGMGMEKDKLMQAAMRLRQLAQKQSVSLWGMQAVTLAIRRDNKLHKVASINSREVIKWVTKNTIEHINADLFPVAIRKVNFQLLKKAEALLIEAPTTMDSLTEHCQEKEMFELDEFYLLSPRLEDLADRLFWYVSTRSRTFWLGIEQELESKQLMKTVFYEKVFDKSDRSDFRKLLFIICEELVPYLQPGFVRNSLDEDEEKEVEAQFEVIQEQEVVSKVDNREEYVEKPWNAQLILQSDFIQLAEQRKIVMPLNGIKHFIQVPGDLKNIIWHKNIYMTANFIHTVKSLPNEMLDNYLRPVDAVLIHRSVRKSTAVLLSGQEAAHIKLTCYQKLGLNILLHINDVDGPTQLPVGSSVSKQEQKLLTIVKLFSGECHYTTIKEVRRIAKRIGLIYPSYFTCLNVPNDFSKKLFGILIVEGYLDFAGVMTEKLLAILRRVNSGDSLSLNLPKEYQSYNKALLGKLHRIFLKLMIQLSSSLKSSHDVLWQWVGTRGRLREYPGSALESVLSPEYELRCSQ